MLLALLQLSLFLKNTHKKDTAFLLPTLRWEISLLTGLIQFSCRWRLTGWNRKTKRARKNKHFRTSRTSSWRANCLRCRDLWQRPLLACLRSTISSWWSPNLLGSASQDGYDNTVIFQLANYFFPQRANTAWEQRPRCPTLFVKKCLRLCLLNRTPDFAGWSQVWGSPATSLTFPEKCSTSSA